MIARAPSVRQCADRDERPEPALAVIAPADLGPAPGPSPAQGG